jgi:hypothetical protein
MATEAFANVEKASATLSSALTAAATSAEASAAPPKAAESARAQFRCRLQAGGKEEIIVFEGGKSTTWKVITRAAEECPNGEKTANEFASGTELFVDLTAGGLVNSLKEASTATVVANFSPYFLDPTGTVVDTAKLQEALNAIHTAGGGVIVFPRGTFKFNYEIAVPYDVWVRGAGRNGTILQWTTDLGAGSSAMRTEEESSSLAYPRVSDLSLKGPGSTTFEAGVAPAEMHGLLLKSEGEAVDVNAYGFKSGISFNGNHQTVERCRCYGNYSGLYWRDGGSSFGNQHVSKVECISNNLAGIQVHKTNTIDSSTLTDVHVGFSPFGIFKGNEAGASKGILTNSVCTPIWFEEVGNAAIFDDGANQVIKNNLLFPGAVTINSEKRWSAKPHEWTVKCGEFLNNTIGGDTNGFPPSEKGVFSVTKSLNNYFPQAGKYLSEMTGGTLLFNDSAEISGTVLITEQGGRCVMMKVGGGENPELGDLLYLATGVGTVFGAAKSGAAEGGSNVPVGFLQAWGLSAVNHWAPVLVQGVGPQKANAESELAANSFLFADTTHRGKVKAATAEQLEKNWNLVVGIGKGTSGTKAEATCRLASF